MESRPLPLYSFGVLIRAAKRRWLVAPLAALILLFSAGAAIAPECHIGITTQTPYESALIHTHSGVPHDHSPQLVRPTTSNTAETNNSLGNTIEKEICFLVGFIVLMLIRFSHALRAALRIIKAQLPRLSQPLILRQNLSYLQLTHLKLGIIRI
jgi:hypothetical protein